MSVSSKLIPTYGNAVEFSSYIMDRRGGIRAVYSESTDPTLKEINDRLLSSESAIDRRLRNSWKSSNVATETVWYPYYTHPYFQYSYRNLLNKKQMPSTVNFQHAPVISVTSITCIIDGAEVDIVASATYTEGWYNSYYIDYQNGILYFKTFKPQYRSPVKIVYRYGNAEDDIGEVIEDILDITSVAETSIQVTLTSTDGQYNGKLIEVLDGTAVGNTYRIITSTHSGGTTTLNLATGTTAVTDGLADTDTIRIYGVPADIKEMVFLHCFLGMLNLDPTYQHNLTYAPEEPSMNLDRIQWMFERFEELVSYRETRFTLIN